MVIAAVLSQRLPDFMESELTFRSRVELENVGKTTFSLNTFECCLSD